MSTLAKILSQLRSSLEAIGLRQPIHVRLVNGRACLDYPRWTLTGSYTAAEEPDRFVVVVVFDEPYTVSYPPGTRKTYTISRDLKHITKLNMQPDSPYFYNRGK